MMSSKGASTVSCPGFGFARSGVFPPSFSFFSATAPSLPALLGSCAEAGPSGATSATRYEQPERISFALGVVPELEFVHVQRQIGFADLVKIADDAALDQGPEAFDVLGMHGADDVLLARMPDDLMRVLAVQAAIADPFVADQQRHLVGNDLAHEAFEGVAINAIDDAGNDLALAANRADDRLLTGAEATTTGAAAISNMPVLALPPTKVSSTSTSPNNWPLALFFIATRRRWHMYQAVS